MRYLCFTIVFFAFAGSAFAQNFATVFPKKNYPTHDFKSPIKFPISLAGNYGECRPNHFHSGIDIRTEQVENKPIHAIAGGYVSRIKISHSGFGNALYISHPNGYTSLYAHLNSFSPKIQKFVEKVQYNQKKWDIDYYFNFYDLIVLASEQVALSGNTGSSLAPHLHLEIRDTKTENTLNPWLFGFDIPDQNAPKLYSLGYYNFSKPDQFYALEGSYLPLSGSNNKYQIEKPLVVPMDKIGFSLQAIDFMDDMFGKLGVFETQMYVDGQLHFAWQLNDISYDNTRALNAFADYKAHVGKNKWYECAFRLPGNQLQIYQDPKKTNGLLDLSDGQIHAVNFKLYDVKGNLSELSLKVQQSSNPSSTNGSCAHPLAIDKDEKVETSDIKALFVPHTFYNTVCLSITKNGDIFSVGNSGIPLDKHFKMMFPIQVAESQKAKLIVEQMDEKLVPIKGAAANYIDGFAVCEAFKELGNFKVAFDNTPPAYTCNISNGGTMKTGQTITLTATDNATSVKKISLLANGQWLCLKRKKDMYSYKIDNHCPKGNITFEVTASDENGNTLTKTYKTKLL